MNNPFKFGTIVDGEYFTDRVAEQEKVREILASENHLILISPRRFGKTSLVQKVTKGLSRPVFQLNLQLVTGTADFAARLLWIMLQQYPMERLKHLITHFRFIPTISTNPMTDGIEVSFQPSMDGFILLEDVFTLIDKLGMKNPHKKPIVVLDEFQEIRTLDKNLDKKLRSILQTYNHANYIFLGGGVLFIIIGILIRQKKAEKKAPLPEKKAFICPACKKEIDSDSIYCSHCGRKIIM